MSKAITIPEWVKSLVAVGGIFLALIGVQLSLGVLCRASSTLSYATESSASLFLIFILALSAMGTGGALAWQTLASLQKKRSRSLPRPSTDQLIGMAVLYVFISLIVVAISLDGGSGPRFIAFLLLPIILALPSLWVFSWLRGKQPDQLTWRYGLIVFTGSGFLSLMSLLCWQGFSYFVLLPLRPELANLFLIDLNSVTGPDDLSQLIYFLVGVTLITELIKPLPALLLWPQLNRREAFLGGALAGAGFAPLAAALYWLLVPEAQVTVLTVTITGATIQIFSSGLVTLGWYQVAEKGSGWPRWLAYYGLAVALQLLWNLGFLLMAGFTALPIGLDWLGGWFLLFTLSLLTLWGSYSITHQSDQPAKVEEAVDSGFGADRSLAIWGAACFLAIIPVGLVLILQ